MPSDSLPSAARPGAGSAAPVVIAGCVALLAGLGLFLTNQRLGLAGLALPFVPVLVTAPGHALLLLVAALPFDSIASVGEDASLSVTRLIGVAVMGGWLVHILTHRRRLRLGAPGFLLLGYVAFAAASILWSADTAATTDALRSTLQLVIFYLMVVDLLGDPAHLERAFNALIVATAALAVITVTQFTGANEFANRAVRATVRYGTNTFDPNYLAGTLVVAVLGALVLGRARGPFGWWRLVALLGMGVTSLITGSRGATAALLGGLAVLGLARPRFAFRGVGALFAIVALLVAFMPAGYTDRLLERYQRAETDHLAGRLEIWKVGSAMIHDRPLQGTGLASFPAVFSRYLGETVVDPKFARAEGTRGHHNIYVGTVAELGIIGGGLLFSALAAHCVAVWRGFRRAVKARDVRAQNLLLATLCMTVGWLIMGMTVDITRVKLTWFILGVAQAVALASERRRSVGAMS